jgi:hypothetical protein
MKYFWDCKTFLDENSFIFKENYKLFGVNFKTNIIKSFN